MFPGSSVQGCLNYHEMNSPIGSFDLKFEDLYFSV